MHHTKINIINIQNGNADTMSSHIQKCAKTQKAKLYRHNQMQFELFGFRPTMLDVIFGSISSCVFISVGVCLVVVCKSVFFSFCTLMRSRFIASGCVKDKQLYDKCDLHPKKMLPSHTWHENKCANYYFFVCLNVAIEVVVFNAYTICVGWNWYTFR